MSVRPCSAVASCGLGWRSASRRAARPPALLASPGSSDMRSHAAAPAAVDTATSHVEAVTHAHAGAPGATTPALGKQTRPPPSAADVKAKALADAHDEQLYQEIRACEHWQDVLDIVSDEGPEMSTKRGVQALTRLLALMKRLPVRERASTVEGPAFSALLSALYAKLPSMKASQLSATVAALAELRVCVGPETCAALCEAAGARASGLPARDLTTVLHALAALGAKPGMSVMDRLGYRAHLILTAQTAQTAQVLGAYAVEGREQAGAQAQDEAEAQAQGATTPDADAAAAQQQAQQDAEPAAHAQQQQHDQQQHAPPSSQHAQGHAQQALGGAGAPPAAAPLEGFTPQGVGMLLHAVASVGYSNARLTGSACSVALDHLSEFAPQGVANTLWALAKLGHYDAALVSGCLEQVSKCGAGQLRPQEAANMLWACQRLRHHPQDAATSGAASATELAGIAWALALLGETRSPAFGAACAALPARFDAGEMDDGLLRQAFQALLCAKLSEAAGAESTPSTSAPPSPPSPVFPELMLDAMRGAWVAGIQRGAARARAVGSPTRALSGLVSEELKVRHDAARTTKDGLVLIDIALRPTDERYVALQVLRDFDTPRDSSNPGCRCSVLRDFDTTRNTGQLLGSVQFERQVLEKNGWEVKFLRYGDLLKVDEPARPYFIGEYLRNIGCRVVRHVDAPGARTGAAAGAAPTRARGARDPEAREADIALSDPKARTPTRRGRQQ
ncbi:hypothetical protein FOA52_014115 [Chlamydomonas sp. UWO 241]|nr:hypothetical protein FOA52_014115 [Chlamydomonas sp. UWO 241]